MIVFHTDVTKILSADSYLTSRFSPGLALPPPSDPNAQDDFVEVVDVVTNNTLLQYRPAEGQTGHLNSVCVHTSEKTQSIRPPVSKPIRDVSGVTKDAADALLFFLALHSSKKWVSFLAKWVRFQVSTNYLQNIFWNANCEEELKLSLEVFEKNASVNTQLIRHAVSMLGDYPLGYAADYLDLEFWTPSKFFVAYCFWAYIKGLRFSRGLTDEDNYIVHWLRRNVLRNTDDAELGSLEPRDVCIPWGEIVDHQLRSLPKHASIDALFQALWELRKYSIADSGSATNRKQRVDFLSAGLSDFKSNLGINAGIVVNLADMTGDLASGVEPGLGHGAKFLLQQVKRPIQKARARKTIRYLESKRGRVADYIENGMGAE